MIMNASMEWLQPALQGVGGVLCAVSTRVGGVSEPPYDSLNLGRYTPDRPEAVRENYARFASALDLRMDRLASVRQVHGAASLCVEAPGAYGEADALLCSRPGIALTVTLADCAPVLLYDPKRRAIAAIHAGWRGAQARIASRALRQMEQAYGVRAADCRAYIGPCIGPDDFETGPEVAAAFEARFSRYDPVRQRYLVDLSGALAAELENAGIFPENIEIAPETTYGDPARFFSHRRDRGATGRMAALICLT